MVLIFCKDIRVLLELKAKGTILNFYYSCSECGIKYSIRPDLKHCPDCSCRQEKDRPLRGVLDVEFSISDAERWYHKLMGLGSFDIYSLLPVEKRYFPDITIGNTPLWGPEFLRKKTGFLNLYLKDETCHPTGSIKDRASYLVAAFALKYGLKELTVFSNGNTGASMAGVCAAAGLKLNLVLQRSTAKTKLFQAMQYGAVITEQDLYKKTDDFNYAHSPINIEGVKTSALEIVKQLGHVPDYVFVPVGEGQVISGIYKGFIDLIKIRLISKMPIIYAVQAMGSNALYRACNEGDFMTISKPRTVADSISVDIPHNGYHAMKNIKDHKGKCIMVTDEEILKAQTELASCCGLFAEPASASALAGLNKSRIDIPAHSIVVLLITGNGLNTNNI
jgi:threonine synthase